MPNPKELRKQLRNVVQDLAPNLITEELYIASLAKVKEEIKLRLDAIEVHVKEALQTLDNRQKDIQSYLVRAAIAQGGPMQAPAHDGVNPTAQPTEDK